MGVLDRTDGQRLFANNNTSSEIPNLEATCLENCRCDVPRDAETLNQPGR